MNGIECIGGPLDGRLHDSAALPGLSQYHEIDLYDSVDIKILHRYVLVDAEKAYWQYLGPSDIESQPGRNDRKVDGRHE